MRWIGFALGVLMLVAGGLWALEGLGWVGDGDPVRGPKTTLGPVIAGLGVALSIVSLRRTP